MQTSQALYDNLLKERNVAGQWYAVYINIPLSKMQCNIKCNAAAVTIKGLRQGFQPEITALTLDGGVWKEARSWLGNLRLVYIQEFGRVLLNGVVNVMSNF